MDDIIGMEGAEYDLYWETQRFFEAGELDSWGFEDALSCYYDSSSPDGSVGGGGAGGGGGASSSSTTKSIAQERDRRKRLNERLYALRSLVPSITKMDKVSIIKDAIDYILDLQQQERKMLAEITGLEESAAAREGTKAPPTTTHDDDGSAGGEQGRRKKRRTVQSSSEYSPINVMELKVREVGEKTSVVSITCSKKKDTIVRLCDALASLRLKILAANITSFSGNLLHTLCVETDEMEGPRLKEKIEAALAAIEI